MLYRRTGYRRRSHNDSRPGGRERGGKRPKGGYIGSRSTSGWAISLRRQRFRSHPKESRPFARRRGRLVLWILHAQPRLPCGCDNKFTPAGVPLLAIKKTALPGSGSGCCRLSPMAAALRRPPVGKLHSA